MSLDLLEVGSRSITDCWHSRYFFVFVIDCSSQIIGRKDREILLRVVALTILCTNLVVQMWTVASPPRQTRIRFADFPCKALPDESNNSHLCQIPYACYILTDNLGTITPRMKCMWPLLSRGGLHRKQRIPTQSVGLCAQRSEGRG